MEVSKKILYVITKANWGGAQRYVFDLALSAKVAGFEPIVAYGQEGELTIKLRAAGIPIIPLVGLGRDVSVGADRAAYSNLKKTIAEQRPGILHLNSSKAGALGALAGRQAGVPKILFTAHGWAFNEDRSLLQKIFIWFGHYATVLLAHRTIAVSRATLRGARYMPFVAHKLVLIPLGISEPEFLPREEARTQLAAKMSIQGEGVLWIGTLAELTWNKGVHHLIRAAGELKRRGAKFILCVLGEGEERKFLETLIEEQGLQSEVRLPGFVSDGRQYLRAFDIFALASHTEALGYALIEAGYAGLPVVATNVGGIPEVVDNGISGLLVPTANPAKLAEALASLVKNAQTRLSYGEALGAAVRQRFALTRMCQQTLALYLPAGKAGRS